MKSSPAPEPAPAPTAPPSGEPSELRFDLRGLEPVAKARLLKLSVDIRRAKIALADEERESLVRQNQLIELSTAREILARPLSEARARMNDAHRQLGPRLVHQSQRTIEKVLGDFFADLIAGMEKSL